MVKFWLSGSFKIRVGVKTSLVTDTENEIILTVARLRYCLDGTIASAV